MHPTDSWANNKNKEIVLSVRNHSIYITLEHSSTGTIVLTQNICTCRYTRNTIKDKAWRHQINVIGISRKIPKCQSCCENKSKKISHKRHCRSIIEKDEHP
jgi:hypothetical protein